MKSYIYQLIVYEEVSEGVLRKIKRFLGNDKNILQERYEMWVIHQGIDKADLKTNICYVQHAGYVAK